MQRRDLGYAGGGFALVAGTALVAYSVAGLSYRADQADHWKAQAQAPRPTTTVTASAAPASAPSSSPSSASPGTPGFRAPVEPAGNPSGSAVSPQPVTRPTPHPTATPPRPAPTHTSTPAPTSRCATAVVLTVRLPLGVLPCNAVVIAGGS
jgi:hypothetical protein